MPYKDPAKRRAVKAASYRKRLADPDFAAAEAARKAAWLQTDTGKQKNAAATRRAREKEEQAVLRCAAAILRRRLPVA